MSYKTFFEYNMTPVQAKNSKSCAEFCIFFVVNRLMNLDLEFEDLVNDIFDVNCNKNEGTVQEFMSILKK